MLTAQAFESARTVLRFRASAATPQIRAQVRRLRVLIVSPAAFVLLLLLCTFSFVSLPFSATGTGVALDAVSRGLKVALVERDDFASGPHEQLFPAIFLRRCFDCQK
jgi:hypothetical protein